MQHSKAVTSGFTLIELMIVIAIMAILVALAMPAYQDYAGRTRVSEAVSISAAAKTAVGTTCQKDSTISPSNNSVGYGFSSSDYVQTVTISNTCAQPWIVIWTWKTGAATNVILSIDGFFNNNTGRVTWNCHRVAGLKRHMPESCRDNHSSG